MLRHYPIDAKQWPYIATWTGSSDFARSVGGRLPTKKEWTTLRKAGRRNPGVHAYLDLVTEVKVGTSSYVPVGTYQRKYVPVGTYVPLPREDNKDFGGMWKGACRMSRVSYVPS